MNQTPPLPPPPPPPQPSFWRDVALSVAVAVTTTIIVEKILGRRR